ncbi:MAG: 50S ribosomal protein L19 [Candidatus Pacebacteria bacterium]|nr:50S ribosomal protein L19 [Candidatus Paceibacterota bacterium]
MEIRTTVISPVDVKSRKEIDIRAGDTVKVWQKIKEGDKTRLQAFEGLVIARKHGKEAGGTFTVRKVFQGVGVEKIFPLYSPVIEKIEILKRSRVRRAKLYHVREKAAKEVRREMRNIRALPEIDVIDESASAQAKMSAEKEKEAVPKQTEETKKDETEKTA